MNLLLRPLVILAALLPFALSLLRDYRRFIFFGAPRRLSSAQRHARAERLVGRIAMLGPTFIKLAQVLAMREDMLPKLYTDELKKLQDQVPPFPLSQVRQIVQQEFNRPLEELFEQFEAQPIAAASLGQVHRARYQGQLVAVKVLRPNVEQLVSTDLQIVKWLLYIGRRLLGSRRYLRNLTAVINEFSRVIYEEIDFVVEAANIDEFRRNVASIPKVIVPEYYPEASGRRVLTLKFYEGVRADDVEALRALQLDPMQVLRSLVLIYTHMIVVHGLLHADPHPGNLLVDPMGNIIILDYGMVVRFSPEIKMELLKTATAAVRGDINSMVNSFYKLGVVEPGTNMATLRDAARVLMNINFTTQYTPRMIQRITEDILRTFHEFPLRLPSNLVYLLRATALIEGIGISFDPKFNGVRFSTPIVREIVHKVYIAPERTALDRTLDKAMELLEFFDNLESVVFRLEREELHVRLHSADFGEIEGYLAALVRRIICSLFAVIIATISAVVFLNSGNYTVLVVGELIAFMLLFVVLILPPRFGPRGE